MSAYPFKQALAKREARKARRLEKRKELQKASKEPRVIKRKPLIKQLDNLFSLWIRKRDGVNFGGLCAVCLNAPATQCFHIITRSKHSVRWDERNAWASCAGCNLRYEFDQTLVYRVMEKYKERFGVDYLETLIRDSNKIAGFSMNDLLEIKDGLVRKLEAA